MANGLMYPTGISADPIDVTSGAQAFMKSAVEARLGEIASSQERISENQKYVLKALSAKAVPELAREQRDRYTKEIEDYRKKVVGKFRSSGGELTMRDQTEIQDGFVDLEQRQLGELNELKQYQKAQDVMSMPNFQYGYDVEKYATILADKYKNLMEGKGIGNMSADLAQAQIPASVGDYLDKRYGKDIKSLDTFDLGSIKGNIFTETQYQGLALENNPDLTPLQKEGVKKAQRKRDEMMQDPNMVNRFRTPEGTVDEQKLQQSITDFISPVKQKSSIISRSSGRQGGDRYKNAIDYTPTKFERGGMSWNIVPIPGDVSQTARNFLVNKAKNIDTGESVQLTQDNAQIVGFDSDKGVILISGKGGNAKRGGEDVYVREGSPAKKDDGAWRGNTESQIDNVIDKEKTLRLEYGGSRKISEVKGVKVDKSDGEIVLSGTIVLEKPDKKTGKKEMPVSVKYTTFKDPSGDALFEADMVENQGALAPLYPKVLVRGKTMDQIFSELKSKKPQAKESSQEIERLDKASGKIAIFDANTKKFIRWK